VIVGYLTAGKILRIDLTDQTITTEPTARYEEKFIGGKGIAAKILYDEVAPGTDALGAGNALIFAAGALSGTLCPASSRTHLLSKSPLTGLMGSCDCGGLFGPELKFAGYDAVVVKGRADTPVYIAIDNEQVEIRDASGVWGRDTNEAQAAIRQELDDPEVQIFCIGPAGEKMVRYAIIAHTINSAASRGGLGAVMGSKNLKAIAVHGSKGVKLADPQKFLELSKASHDAIRAEPLTAEMAERGGARELETFTQFGVYGISNFQRTLHAGETDLESFVKQYRTNNLACFSCPMGCRLGYQVPGLQSGALKCFQAGALYQTGCFDNVLNYEAAILCQEGGLDVVQTSNVLSWLMELYQRGIITAKDTDGIAMEFGDGKAAIAIIKKIIAREGVGDLLAEHYLTVAGKFGKGSEDYFMHNKGVAVQAFDLRGIKGSALSGAVSARGDYLTGNPTLEFMSPSLEGMEGEMREQMQQFIDYLGMEIAGTPKAAFPTEYEGKPRAVMFYENSNTLSDMLGVCKHMGPWMVMPLTPDKLAELYSAGKGVEMTLESLMEAAHRVHTLERAFSVREGLTRDQDTLPRRFFQEPVSDGPFKGEKIDPAKLEEMKTDYYALQGWDPATGVPTQETLEKLGLSDVAFNINAPLENELI
jgi:aldehyde:ferredoxin oxidoreductase